MKVYVLASENINIMNNWFDISCKMEKFAQVPYRRVKAQDYMKLMRLVEKKPAGMPATDDMKRLLDKMVADLEDGVANVYINTVAAGHTANTMMYPCPDCYGSVDTMEDISEAFLNNEMLEHHWNLEDYMESEGYYSDPEEVPDEIRQAFERADDTPYGGDGVFICQMCGLIKTPDELDEYMNNPFPGGRGILISDQIDRITKYLQKIKEADSFERKFPYFEGIIEWLHGSGSMSEWFIEGGEATIDKYRNSKLPPRHEEGPYGSWIHPYNREKDWDWSNI